MSEYKYIEEDVDFLLGLEYLNEEYAEEITRVKDTTSFLIDQTNKACEVLESRGFIISSIVSDVKTYAFMPLGKIASNIAEIHPVIISELLMKWNHFKDFSEIQLIAFLSIFTDIKVPENYRTICPRSKDPILQRALIEIKDEYEKLDALELSREMYTGIQYNDVLMYDLVDDMSDWCLCVNEEQCKLFLQQRITLELGISIGDFTKACLKISTISKELSNVCEQMGFIDCLHKLARVDVHILKYIATTQSLYV